MKATILNYRGSYKEQNPKHLIVQPEKSENRKDALKFVGKKVVWTTSSGKKIHGLVSAAHGNKGAVRAVFAEKGLPGQALGTQLEIE